MDEVYQRLEADYSQDIDAATLTAILSDFDLNKDADYQSARAVLDMLKETAAIEGATGFDPSGTGSQDLKLDVTERTPVSSGEGTSASNSKATDLTSLSSGLSSRPSSDPHSELESPQQLSEADLLTRMDEETKVERLVEFFSESNLSRSSVRRVLRKCKGDFNAALNEILTIVSFSEAPEDGFQRSAKGIEAFDEEFMSKKARKRKSKGGKLRLDSSSSSPSPSPVTSPATPSNKWKDSNQEIEYLVSRIRLPAAVVTSTYHKNGANMSHTINALLKAAVSTGKSKAREDPVVVVNANQLREDFPRIAPEYALALIRLTHPSTVAAHEVAIALTARPAEGGVQIVPKYKPVDLDLNSADATPPSVARTSPITSTYLDASLSAGERADQYKAARDRLYEQGKAAHRNASSGNFLGLAASYYAEEARDRSALHLHAKSVAMDEQAACQSSLNQVDLHGIDVSNAVRIAKDYVTAWWSRLGESRVNGRVGAAARAAGYSIVVGRGIHSEGGKAKLGPAVSDMLSREGWKYEHAGAVIVVTGKAKR